MEIDVEAALADTRSEYDKMVAGDWYRYRLGPELGDLTTSTQRTCRRITALYDDDRTAAEALFRELLGSVGEGVDFRPPFYLDHGARLHVGDRTFINADLLTLGGGEIRIGADVLIGPSVRLYTPTHVLDPELRAQGWERVSPVTIEDGVWLGGSVVVCPGVTIGARTVVGAGSVVTKNLPADVIAVGNPARPVRHLDGSRLA